MIADFFTFIMWWTIGAAFVLVLVRLIVAAVKDSGSALLGAIKNSPPDDPTKPKHR